MAISLKIEKIGVAEALEAPHFEARATIGRAEDNDVVLPDPERLISSHHAYIELVEGVYYLVDTSANGTVVGARELARGDRCPLKEGDQLAIGEFRLTVSLRVSAPPEAEAPLPVHQPAPPAPSPAPAPAPAPPEPAVAPPIDDFFVPPKTVPEAAPPAANPIPENWWEEEAQPKAHETPPAAEPLRPVEHPVGPAEPAPQKPAPDALLLSGSHPQAQAPEQPAAGTGDLFAAIGVDPSSVTPGLSTALGQVLRIVVQGMLDTLRARADFKNQFRVERTTLGAQDNNPLKAMPNVEAALNSLFVNPMPGFQDPATAFQEGFDDIRDHQLAIFMALQHAFQNLLKQLHPDNLEERFDKTSKRNMLDITGKARYWEAYRDMFENLGDQEETFMRMFGRPFAEEYERQMHRLMQARRRQDHR